MAKIKHAENNHAKKKERENFPIYGIESIVFSPLSYEILSLGSVPFSCYASFNSGPLSHPLRINGINRRRVKDIFN